MVDLKILFLLFLILTGLFYILRFGQVISFTGLFQLLLGLLFVGAAFLTVATFFFIIFRIDPMPLVRQAGYYVGLQQLVYFDGAIPDNLAQSLEVTSVQRMDTDKDSFKEWVVCYQFDRTGPGSPIRCAIYDNDRGNPPVIFPYNLSVPDRDYLSEATLLGEDLNYLNIDMVPVTTDQNGPDGQDVEEIVVKGNRELSIFRFQQNSEIWDFPRDAPPRYQPIGFFRGSGGVEFDRDTKRVTVLDRDGFERSQLVVRSVYGINPATNSYMDSFDPAKLTAPIVSTIDFFPEPPEDILNTTFPEKIVLGFYASTCGSSSGALGLCRSAAMDWTPRQFLAPDSEALTEFNNSNPTYFGLPGSTFGGSPDISVSHLCYYPSLETDPDLLETGGGRDVVTGEQAQFNVVDIEFIVPGSALEWAHFVMRLVDGQWKIAQRLDIDTPLCGQAETQILAAPE